MHVVFEVLYLLLYIFFILLIARLVLSWVLMFAPRWEPRGVLLVLVEGILTLTDPPIRAVRKVVPSPQIGPVRLDLSFLIVMVIVYLLMAVTGRLMQP